MALIAGWIIAHMVKMEPIESRRMSQMRRTSSTTFGTVTIIGTLMCITQSRLHKCKLNLTFVMFVRYLALPPHWAEWSCSPSSSPTPTHRNHSGPDRPGQTLKWITSPVKLAARHLELECCPVAQLPLTHN